MFGRNGVRKSGLRCIPSTILAILVNLALAGIVCGQQPAQTDESLLGLDIYGFAMLDTGYQVGQNHPDWFDVVRPVKLPAFENEFGKDGRWYSSVRQSRFGVKGYIPTSLGQLRTIFEFELFGTGVDAGQTTFRLRHAWGELKQIGAGQTWSPFMDIDVFPNSIEYWGPNGMVFFRNVQVRYTPWQKGDSRIVLALERPGASADQGPYADRIQLEDVRGRFPLPDFSGHVRLAKDWGHLQVAGIVRKMKWDDLTNDAINLSGSDIGWGVNVSSNVKLSRHVLRLQAVYGEGIQNYMNDAPVDVGVENNLSDPVQPIKGKALPLLGLVAFLDLNWSPKWTSTVGYSRLDIDNSSGQLPSAFKSGQYALANVLWHPVPEFFMGPELQWGYRDNNSDGFHSRDVRIQFSLKYNFSYGLSRRP